MGVYYDIYNHTKKQTLCGHIHCFKTKPPTIERMKAIIEDNKLDWSEVDTIEAWSCETMYVYDFKTSSRVEDRPRFVTYMESSVPDELSTQEYYKVELSQW